jgi:hypothetical protein
MKSRINHVIARALERYDLRLTAKDVEHLEDLIARESAGVRFIGFMEDGTARYTVLVGAKELRVMWDTATNTIKSLLPAYGECGGSFKVSQSLGEQDERRREKP